MLLKVTVPEESLRIPKYTEQILDALHQHAGKHDQIVLHFGQHDDHVGIFCSVPQHLLSTTERGLQSAYDGCEVERLSDGALSFPKGLRQWAFSLTLRPDVFSIKELSQFEDLVHREYLDPLSGVLSRLEHGIVHTRIDLIIRPARWLRSHFARRLVETLDRSFLKSHICLSRWFALQGTSARRLVRWLVHGLAWILRRTPLRGNDDTTHRKVRGHSLFEAVLVIRAAGDAKYDQLVREHVQSVASSFGIFTSAGIVDFELRELTNPNRLPRPFLLSSAEVSTLWHPATRNVRTKSLSTTRSRRLEPPPRLPSREKDSRVVEIGETLFQDRRERFGLLPVDRLRHFYLVGKTGAGKSTVLTTMMQQDMEQGSGVCLIDPHGDLATDILNRVPPCRIQDVIWFDAADRSHPIGFNPLQNDDPLQRQLIADGVVSVFKKTFGLNEGVAPRLLYILKNALLTLLERPDATLVDLSLILTDPVFRKREVSRLPTGPVRHFWQHEFQPMPQRERAMAVSAILNKTNVFVTNDFLKVILGQRKSSFRFRQVMDEGKILIVNLSKGRVGEDASHLLGGLLISALEGAALSRSNIDEEHRRPFYCYIDEFQNFATESFAGILSEARKYGLGLTLAHQYLDQLDEDTRHAVFGNVGSLMSFQVGSNDPPVPKCSDTFRLRFGCPSNSCKTTVVRSGFHAEMAS